MVSVEGMPHVWISNQNANCCWYCAPATRFDDPKPFGLISVDTRLWQDFSSEIDHHVSKLNVGMRLAFTIMFSITVPLVATVTIISHVPPLRDVFIDYSKYFPLAIFPPMIMFYCIYFNTVRRNQEADEGINNVCRMFQTKFESKGFSIEYRTKWTHLCKPKHAIPRRAIVFPPTPGSQESRTIDNRNDFTNDSDLIDRKNGELT